MWEIEDISASGPVDFSLCLRGGDLNRSQSAYKEQLMSDYDQLCFLAVYLFSFLKRNVISA
jgi:hypothetical protein